MYNVNLGDMGGETTPFGEYGLEFLLAQQP